MSSLSLLMSLLLLTTSFTDSLEALNQTTQVIREVSRRDTPILPWPYLHLPEFVESSLPLVDKEYFSPAKGTGHEPLPGPVREILLPAMRPRTPPPSVSGVAVRILCKLNKMYVVVQKSVLGPGETHHHLKLGTCHASKSTRDYLHFEYDLGMCGTKRTVIDNRVAYLNTLHYDPPRLRGPIRRAVPFTLPVACYYNRYQYSYKIGYTPRIRMHKIFRLMNNRAKFSLTPRNAQWKRLSASDHYVLGKPMYFEAEAPYLTQDERLYVHSCYVTPEKSHTSTPQFLVVANFGCMVESKDNRSRFIPYKNNVVRFSVDAFLFKGMTGQQLYMHCIMFVGGCVPSPTAKSCNYNTEAGRWVELYGPDSVCTCCDSNCSSDATTVTKIIRSRPWTIEPKVKPSTSFMRKTVSTVTKRAPPRPEMTREVIEWRMTTQPEVIAVTQMGEVEKGLERLFQGGGEEWAQVEGEERWVKGSAVVEEEVVTEPLRIFEEIFDFDK